MRRAALCQAHSGLVEQLEDIHRRLAEGRQNMQQIETKIDDIRNGLNSRPSWGIVLLVTTLCALLGVLATLLAGS